MPGSAFLPWSSLRPLGLLGAAALGVLLSAPVRADVPPPELGPCWRRSAGEACVLEEDLGERRPGKCVLSTCSHRRQRHLPDGRREVYEEREECLLCKVEEASKTPPPAEARPPAEERPAPAPDDAARGGARSAPRGLVRRAAPWAIAAAFALLFLALRRRKAA